MTAGFSPIKLSPMYGAEWKIVRGERGPEYRGPHGPIPLPPSARERTEFLVTGAEGEPAQHASLDWAMGHHDRDLLSSGVSVSIGGESLVLRLEKSKKLVLRSAAGEPIAHITRGHFGRAAVFRGRIRRSEGGRLVSKVELGRMCGDLSPDANSQWVQLILLLVASGVLLEIERSWSMLPLFIPET
jgi:hypothetical protein